MLRYGLYTRKSHDDKKLTEKSTGEQSAECQSIANREGLCVVWTAEESKSAKVPGVRPLYSDLIRFVEKGKIDAIICWHVNRLVRNMEEGGKLVQLLIDGKIKEIRTPHATYRSGENILAVVIEAASATQFSIDLVHTVARSMDGNFRAGGWNHKAPPGYKNARDPLNTKRGQIETDANQIQLIRKAWGRMLSGDCTAMDVYRALGEWGYRIRPSLNLPSRPLGYLAVLSMFRNPFYAGYVRQKGEIVRGRHEPIVTLDQFRRVQEILARRTFTAKRVHNHAYTGLLQCAYCGQQVTAETKKLRTGHWTVYHCSDTYNRCDQKGLSASSLERQIIERFLDIEIDPEVLTIATAEVTRGLESQAAALIAENELRLAALSNIDQRLNRLTEMWLSGLLSDEQQFKNLETAAQKEKQKLQMAAEGSASEHERMLRTFSVAVQFVKTGRSRFLAASSENKRAIARALGTFKFYGREKRIEVEIRPVLREVVRFSSQFSAPLEPPNRRSGSKEKAALREPLYLGRPKHSGIELPEPLLDALKQDDIASFVESDFGARPPDQFTSLEEAA